MCCRNCGANRRIEARGLCCRCYSKIYRRPIDITKLYANRGRMEKLTKKPPMPSEATQAHPGSREKATVMAERYERGEQIFHPDDLTWGDV